MPKISMKNWKAGLIIFLLHSLLCLMKAFAISSAWNIFIILWCLFTEFLFITFIYLNYHVLSGCLFNIVIGQTLNNYLSTRKKSLVVLINGTIIKIKENPQNMPCEKHYVSSLTENLGELCQYDVLSADFLFFCCKIRALCLCFVLKGITLLC